MRVLEAIAWIEIKRIQIKFLFDGRQSIATVLAVNFVCGWLRSFENTGN